MLLQQLRGLQCDVYVRDAQWFSWCVLCAWLFTNEVHGSSRCGWLMLLWLWYSGRCERVPAFFAVRDLFTITDKPISRKSFQLTGKPEVWTGQKSGCRHKAWERAKHENVQSMGTCRAWRRVQSLRRGNQKFRPSVFSMPAWSVKENKRAGWKYGYKMKIKNQKSKKWKVRIENMNRK